MAWYNYGPIKHGYIPYYEGPNTDTPHYADDVPTPFHTDITTLFEGDVVKADYQPWGGEVFIRTNVPGIGPTEEYFYHLDRVDVSERQHIKRGDHIGISGGQTSGGLNPVQNTPEVTWSTGPHTHVGFFSGKYVPIPGGHGLAVPSGPDITPYLGTGGASTGDSCSQYAAWDPRYYFCLLQSGLIPGTHNPCDSCSGATKVQCHAALAAKVGKIPNCAQKDIAKNKQEVSDAAFGKSTPSPCDKFPGGWLNPEYVLCQGEQGIGVESNSDLLYRAGFIAAGVLFIVFGLMIFSKSFSPTVSLGG